MHNMVACQMCLVCWHDVITGLKFNVHFLSITSEEKMLLQGVGLEEYHKYSMSALTSSQLSNMAGNACLDLNRGKWCRHSSSQVLCPKNGSCPGSVANQV